VGEKNMKKLNFDLYYIYDKKTGEVYHINLWKSEMKRLKLKARLLGLKVKIKKQKGIISNV
jgi:hypothetical protein